MTLCTMGCGRDGHAKYGGPCDTCWDRFISPHDKYIERGMCPEFKDKLADGLWCNQKAGHDGRHTTNPKKIDWPRK